MVRAARIIEWTGSPPVGRTRYGGGRRRAGHVSAAIVANFEQLSLANPGGGGQVYKFSIGPEFHAALERC
jgi:hypothetical protein